MAFQPKAEPGSSPRSISTFNKKSYNEMSISELVSVLRVAFQMKDFDEVEEELVNREAKLRAEIGPLREKIELERLNSIEAEERLKMREEQCEKGKRAQENYEQLLKEVKKSGLVEKITIEELRTKNVALESEICELKEFKKKMIDDGNSVAELRAKIRVLEEEKVGDKSALDSLNMKNIELEEAVKKNLTVIEGLRTENGKLTDEKNELNLEDVFAVQDEEDVGDHELENDTGELDAGTAQSPKKGNKDEAVGALGMEMKISFSLRFSLL
ncbi:hypothetical protein VNO80_05302 [Phaseolus coccineus]|uniref:Uncharacterized protein n=1 Tax=Phaseolus coccineus TaxID=3886 RepID=A0AAN9NFM9_PHACN